MASCMPFLADSDPDNVVQFALSKLILIRVMASCMPFLAVSDQNNVVQLALFN